MIIIKNQKIIEELISCIHHKTGTYNMLIEQEYKLGSQDSEYTKELIEEKERLIKLRKKFENHLEDLTKDLTL